MAIAQGSLILSSDMRSWYTRLNAIISKYGGGVITTMTVPAVNKKAQASDVNTIVAKLNQMKADQFLGSVPSMYTAYSVVAVGDYIRVTTGQQLNTVITNLEAIKCRNRATNAYGVNSNTCKNGANIVGCSNGTCGNGANGNSANGNGANGNGTCHNQTCNNGAHGNGANGNQTCSNQTCGNGTNGNGAHGNGNHGNGAHGNGAHGNGAHGNGAHWNAAHGNGTCSNGYCAFGLKTVSGRYYSNQCGYYCKNGSHGNGAHGKPGRYALRNPKPHA